MLVISNESPIVEFNTKFATWKAHNRQGEYITGDIVVPKEFKDQFIHKQPVLVQLDDIKFNSKIVKYTNTWSIHVPLPVTQYVLEYFETNKSVKIQKL